MSSTKRSVETTDTDVEEREGLLTGHASSKVDGGTSRLWSRSALCFAAASLLFCVALLMPFLPMHHDADINQDDHRFNFGEGEMLRSNGTHDFKRTVFMVSIDGLRADYLDRNLTPHLVEISRKGLRAKWMRPVFPTLTFPNHWALMTGLYAESHGIVANNFWDPETEDDFLYSDPEKSWNASWWSGEPIWETAHKAGLLTANLMWPGPPATRGGVSPTYYVPWKNKVPLSEKLDQLMRWIDLPLEERPQLLLAYEASLDQAGHKAGPFSTLVNDTLVYVDRFARDLHTSLASRNLTNIVDIIFVSDHGMTDTTVVDMMYLEDIIGTEYVDAIEHEDGWPCMGLRFRPETNVTHVLELLIAASNKSPKSFSVFTHDTMPAVYHFSHHPRIAPIYVIPEVGYALTTHKEGNDRLTKGTHGYDNTDPTMYAMFVSDGPFSGTAKQRRRLRGRSALDLTSYFTRGLIDNGDWINTGETYVMQGFQNVEIYGLVSKLLGIEAHAAQTNGTQGFWDRYF